MIDHSKQAGCIATQSPLHPASAVAAPKPASSTQATPSAAGIERARMADGDDDDDDLFKDFDDSDASDLNNVNVSNNLLSVCGQEAQTVHKGFGDEGRITWVAPAMCVQHALEM